MDRIKIKRALISVSDKTNLIELATTLAKYGTEIVASGGTKQHLEENGFKVRDIQNFTGSPEAFGGRVKTISFNVGAAILFDRISHTVDAERLNVEAIDMVVCNLYPFEKVMQRTRDEAELIENIDIGGSLLTRSSAKNYKYVASVTDVTDYSLIINELNENDGMLSLATRKKLMLKAFKRSYTYDSIIYGALANNGEEFFDSLTLTDKQEMRYGENPHQKASYFRDANAKVSLRDMKVLSGKEISYNNVLDIAAAVETVALCANSAVAIVKHGTPCGFSSSVVTNNLLKLAWEGDSVSAFGSIIAFNYNVTKSDLAYLMLDSENKSERKFVEVIIAPSFSEDALAYLVARPNLRAVEFPVRDYPVTVEGRYIGGSFLIQTMDSKDDKEFQVVTQKSDAHLSEEFLRFGTLITGMVKSNSIAVCRIAKNGEFQLVGTGGGQPNRVDAVKLAVARAKENVEKDGDTLNNTVLFSDAFFPFSDSIELIHKCGINIVVQPGGSISDKTVIDAANALNMCMIFTGRRHFRH